MSKRARFYTTPINPIQNEMFSPFYYLIGGQSYQCQAPIVFISDNAGIELNSATILMPDRSSWLMTEF